MIRIFLTHLLSIKLIIDKFDFSVLTNELNVIEIKVTGDGFNL